MVSRAKFPLGADGAVRCSPDTRASWKSGLVAERTVAARKSAQRHADEEERIQRMRRWCEAMLASWWSQWEGAGKKGEEGRRRWRKQSVAGDDGISGAMKATVLLWAARPAGQPRPWGAETQVQPGECRGQVAGAECYYTL